MKKWSRIVQKTEESLFSTENKTEYPPALKTRISRADRSHILTKDLVDNVKGIVGSRIPQDRNLLEDLGHSMHEFGHKVEMASTAYGIWLILVGETEDRVGRTEREYVQAVYSQFIEPMEVSLKMDTKSLEREKSQLEKRRLDLDLSIKKEKKAKTNETILTTRQNVQLAQVEFERQGEMMIEMLGRLPKTHEQHLEHLKDFVKQQKRYYGKCYDILQELYDELNEKQKAMHKS